MTRYGLALAVVLGAVTAAANTNSSPGISDNEVSAPSAAVATPGPAERVKEMPVEHAIAPEKFLEEYSISFIEEEKPYHVSFAATVLFPSDTEDWQTAFGIEARGSKWFREDFGYALTIGYTKWNAQAKPVSPSGLTLAYPPTLSGSASVISPGALLFYRPRGDWNSLNLIMEAGIQYQFIDSSMKMNFAYRDHWGNYLHLTASPELDDRLVAVLGFEIGREINPEWSWFLGGGYQFSLSSNDSRFWIQSAGNDLDAFVIRAGLRY